MGARVKMRRLIATVLLAIWMSSASFAQSTSPKRVLLVYQSDGAIPANIAFEQSLAQHLRTAMGPRLEFYHEQLDSTRFPEYTQQKVAALRSQYADLKIDVIIFFGNTLTEVLPGVPVVQVSNGEPDRTGAFHPANFVYVSFNIDALKEIGVAHRLQRKARKVVLISGVAPLDLATLRQFERRLRSDPNLDIQIVDNASVPEVLAMVSHLPKDTIVLPIAYSRDPAGNTYVPRDIVSKLANASTAPVYAVSDTYVGIGAVGGYVVSWTKTGELTAEAAVQIAQGKAPADVVLGSPGSGVYLFDWRQLKRWGFSVDDLPPGSAVEYRTFTAWELYRWRILAGIAIIAAQFLLIVALLVHRRRMRQAEESLRETAGHLLQSQDEERRRIARDLHDGTAQHLSGMALTIGQVLADFPPGNDQLRKLLQDSHVASREALNEIRTVSYVLHPPILDGVGLVPALHWYLEGLQKRTPLRVNLQTPAEIPDISPDGERALFRIVQESITNVIRHSGGSAISVSLVPNGKKVTLEIEDNGSGMSPEHLSLIESTASLGVGIAGMRERVRQLKGTFKISSSPRGTRVVVSIPTNGASNAANLASR